MTKVTSTGNVKKNAVASIADYAAQILFGLLLTPLLLGHLGSELFGIWRAFVRYMSFILMVDGRPAQTLIWSLSHHQRENPTKKKLLINGTWSLWICGAPVLAGAGVILSLFSPLLIESNATSHQLIISISLILSINTVCMSFIELPAGALQGSNLAYTKLYMSLMSTFVLGLLFITGVTLNFDIETLLWLQVVVSLLFALLTHRLGKHYLDWYQLKAPSIHEAKHFFTRSKWYSSWSITNKLLLNGDILLVGFFVGATGVTTYSISGFASFTLVSLYSVVTSNTVTTMGRHPKTERSLFWQDKRLLDSLTSFVALGGGCALLILNPSFVSLWVGSEHFIGYQENLLLTVLGLLALYFKRSAFVLDISMKPEAKLWFGLLSIFITVVTTIFLAPEKGILGICIAIILGRAVLNIAYSILVRRLPQCPAYRIRPAQVLIYSGLIAGSFYTGIYMPVESWSEWLLYGCPLAAMATMAGFFSLSKPSRDQLLSSIRHTERLPK